MLKTDADTIPPIIAKAVLIDVAAWKALPALPARYPIRSKDLKAALAAQGTDIEPGDVVLIRTGTLRHWGETGSDHAAIARHLHGDWAVIHALARGGTHSAARDEAPK